VNVRFIDELQNSNNKLLEMAQTHIEKKRTETMQACYKYYPSSAIKFAKCADESYNKTLKFIEMFQYKLLYSKIDFVDCLVIRKE